MNPLWNEIAGGSLSAQQLQQMDAYLDRLIEKNRVLNLTRITDRADAEVKHVADALTLLPLIDAHLEKRSKAHAMRGMGVRESSKPQRPFTLADIGTGGGIPGAILAIARPQIQVTLMDATRKKLDAVQEICDAVGLTNVRTLHTRVEAVEEKFDALTARAVADVATLLGWCGGLMKRSSILLALKGPRAAEEIAAVPPRARRQWTIETINPNAAPLEGHVILRIEKSRG